MKTFCNLSLIILLTLVSNIAFAKDLSRLKALMNTKVTSVSKKPEDPFYAPAAVYVITKKDIERSGLTSLAEVLRLAPGVQVGQAGANWWGVSARGGNDTLSNKLLVLIDGRSVYNPLFAGVYWDTKDVLLEDIKHIEIIRGPGGTLWGANAVNGVINIITDDAVNTTGTLLTTTQGTDERIYAGRQGGKINDDLYYRVYAKHIKKESFETLTGANANDKFYINRSGFKADWDYDKNNSYSFHGDIYKGQMDRVASLSRKTGGTTDVNDPGTLKGGYFQVDWERKNEKYGVMKIQSYYEHIQRNFSVSRDRRTTFDFDFQHSLPKFKKNEITWGFDYRKLTTTQPLRTTLGNNYFQYSPAGRRDHLYSVFLQDRLHVIPEKWFITLGSKFEINDYTGFEVQPSVRSSWHINDKNVLWAAVSRAVRSPSRFEDDIEQILFAIPNDFVSWKGSREFESEELIAYEVGFKSRPKPNVLVDVAVFFNDYDNLKTAEDQVTANGDDVILQIFDNKGYGESYGLELSGSWDVKNEWQLTGAYTYLITTNHLDSDSDDNKLKLGQAEEGRSPKNQFNIRSRYLFSDKIEMNNYLYYVDNLTSSISTIEPTDDYFRFDTTVGWKPKKGLEINFIGQNLLDDKHKEFNPIGVLPKANVSRSFFVKMSVFF